MSALKCTCVCVAHTEVMWSMHAVEDEMLTYYCIQLYLSEIV